MMRAFIAAILTGCASLCIAAAQIPGDESRDIDLLISARMQIRDGKLDYAEQSTRDFLAKHPASSQAHFLLGFILFREGQTHAAVESTQEKARLSLAEYTEGAKYNRPSSLDLKVVALDYVLLGDYSDADRWLTHSLGLNPKDAESWYYLGRIKESESNLTDAVRAFDQSLALDPLNTRAAEAKTKVLQAESTTH